MGHAAAPPGFLWTWFTDEFRAELACEIARHWLDLAKNGSDPWASQREVIEANLKQATEIRRSFWQPRDLDKIDMRHITPRALNNIISGPVGNGLYTQAPTLVDDAILKWRLKDAVGSTIVSNYDGHRISAPKISKKVRDAFEAIIIANEVPTAYRFIGTRWLPEETSGP